MYLLFTLKKKNLLEKNLNYRNAAPHYSITINIQQLTYLIIKKNIKHPRFMYLIT